jgi:pyruvate,orthophosphate dikinase
MPTYLELGLLKANPFDTVDVDGVGELISHRGERGRMRNPTSRSASAASTAATPPRSSSSPASDSNYVSCSPFRVPVARLAAAQALTKIDAERK